MARLSGRTAIVTGGSRGIGRHYSERLAQEGARVMIADIADGAPLAIEINTRHGHGMAISTLFDVSDEAAVKRVVQETMDAFGQIDILVNNAALYSTLVNGKFTDIDAESWDKVMAVNTKGPFLMAKHVAPHKMARNYGKIINIGSGTSYLGIPFLLHYVSSKGAMTAFSRALSRELGPYNICVNTLAPGLIMSDTGMQNAQHLERVRAPALAARAIKRDAYPEDLLGALVFLASEDSDFVTGQTIAVDGGAMNT